MAATIHARNKISDWLVRGTTFPSITNWYIGLSLSQIDDNGEGIVEPNDSSYSRQEFPRSSSWYDSTSGYARSNRAVIFGPSSEDWGVVLEVFISSSPDKNTSGSVIWFHDELSPTIPVTRETSITINNRALTITSNKEASAEWLTG